MKIGFDFSKQSVILVGFMGSGKTTTGKLLSGMLSSTFIDTDSEIEKEYGMTVPEIFEKEGEETFREMESALLNKLVEKPFTVISGGGGIIRSVFNRDIISKKTLVVWLRCPVEKCVERCLPGSRPLLNSNDALTTAKKLYSEREKLYSAVADIVINTDNSTPDVAAIMIANEIKSGRF